ncbi:phosphotransferase family protein [Brevibacterium antiquum]|uniref:Predicted kinase, aminoglycoside phosphotransferase (APT) family n=1 Tax=Brevibacterium antiquum TaxID=234835 RepID=A0A2H1K1E5_9MICO|nr:phosphotransferase family protein [Brevibacterium antiquum]SMX93536.1 Predicted kinase, aminoglycoside phosphotransferase (APT) family [Brevibacterium antiquum]
MSVELNLTALAVWMRDIGEPVTGELSGTRVGQGQSNLTYRIDDEAGHSWIARRPPLGKLLASAHDVVREYQIMSALQGSGVPVPTTIGVCTDVAVADVPVFVMAHVEGTVVDDEETTRALSPEVRRRLGLDLARTLAKVHAVDIDAVGLGELASRRPYAPRQLKRWTRQLEESRTQERPDLDALTQLLVEHQPDSDEIGLVHGDFHVRNVIIDERSGEIRAVLDWELSTLGDPLADMGSALAYWTQAGDMPGGMFAASTLDGFPTREEMAAEYLRASGRSGQALGFWHVLGVWKVAIIAEGVYRRVLDQPENAAGVTLTPENIQALVDHGWDIARETGLAP